MWQKTLKLLTNYRLSYKLKLISPGATQKAASESMAYAESLLSKLSNSLDVVFEARNLIRDRGAIFFPELTGLAPELVSDVRLLEQAEAIALLTCYGRRGAPEGSGLVVEEDE